MKSWESGLNPRQANLEEQKKEGEMETVKEINETEFSKIVSSKELGVLGKFKGKAKEIAGVLMFISSLSFAPGFAKEAYAEQRKDSPKTGELEKEKSREDAVSFLNFLYNFPDNPNAHNEGHNKALKQEAARAMINLYAARRARIDPHYVSPEQIRLAVEELYNALESFADRFLGDKSGQVDTVDEITKLNQAREDNIMIQTLLQVYLEFTSDYKKTPNK